MQLTIVINQMIDGFRLDLIWAEIVHELSVVIDFAGTETLAKLANAEAELNLG